MNDAPWPMHRPLYFQRVTARGRKGSTNVRFGPKADITQARAEVRFVPKADFDYREILLGLDLPPSAAAESDAQC